MYNYGRKILDLAAMGLAGDIDNLLKKNKSEVNYQSTDNGDTAAIIAAKRNDERTMTILIKHNANLLISNYLGETPLSVATKRNHISILGMMAKQSTNVSDFINSSDLLTPCQ